MRSIMWDPLSMCTVIRTLDKGMNTLTTGLGRRWHRSSSLLEVYEVDCRTLVWWGDSCQRTEIEAVEVPCSSCSKHRIREADDGYLMGMSVHALAKAHAHGSIGGRKKHETTPMAVVAYDDTDRTSDALTRLTQEPTFQILVPVLENKQRAGPDVDVDVDVDVDFENDFDIQGRHMQMYD